MISILILKLLFTLHAAQANLLDDCAALFEAQETPFIEITQFNGLISNTIEATDQQITYIGYSQSVYRGSNQLKAWDRSESREYGYPVSAVWSGYLLGADLGFGAGPEFLPPDGSHLMQVFALPTFVRLQAGINRVNERFHLKPGDPLYLENPFYEVSVGETVSSERYLRMMAEEGKIPLTSPMSDPHLFIHDMNVHFGYALLPVPIQNAAREFARWSVKIMEHIQRNHPNDWILVDLMAERLDFALANIIVNLTSNLNGNPDQSQKHYIEPVKQLQTVMPIMGSYQDLFSKWLKELDEDRATDYSTRILNSFVDGLNTEERSAFDQIHHDHPFKYKEVRRILLAKVNAFRRKYGDRQMLKE